MPSDQGAGGRQASDLETALRDLLKAIEGVGYQSPRLNRAVAKAIRALPAPQNPATIWRGRARQGSRR
jgi:hypothetical protein